MFNTWGFLFKIKYLYKKQKMGKVVRLTESQLKNVIKKIINEQTTKLKIGDSVSITNLDMRPGHNSPTPNKSIRFYGKICNIDGNFATVKGDGQDSGRCWWGSITSEKIFNSNTIYDVTMKERPDSSFCYKCQ